MATEFTGNNLSATRFSQGLGNGVGLNMKVTKSEWDSMVDSVGRVHGSNGEVWISGRVWMNAMNKTCEVHWLTQDRLLQDLRDLVDHRFLNNSKVSNSMNELLTFTRNRLTGLMTSV